MPAPRSATPTELSSALFDNLTAVRDGTCSAEEALDWLLDNHVVAPRGQGVTVETEGHIDHYPSAVSWVEKADGALAVLTTGQSNNEVGFYAARTWRTAWQTAAMDVS